jgi:hypothetical protein
LIWTKERTALVPIVVVMVGMSVPPVPVLRLLPLVRLRVFVRMPVVFREIGAPRAVLVAVPVVVVLVVFVVYAHLNAGLLR